MRKLHVFEKMTAENRPQDPSLNGSDLTFEAMEHGGEFPDCFPLVIEVTDIDGRTCRYAPITENGESVISKGFYSDHQLEMSDLPPDGGDLEKELTRGTYFSEKLLKHLDAMGTASVEIPLEGGKVIICRHQTTTP